MVCGEGSAPLSVGARIHGIQQCNEVITTRSERKTRGQQVKNLGRIALVMSMSLLFGVAVEASQQPGAPSLASPFDFSTMAITPAEMAFAAFFSDRAYDNDPWAPLDETQLMKGGPEKTLVDTEVKVSRIKDRKGKTVYIIAFRGTEGVFSKDLLTDVVKISLVRRTPFKGSVHDGFRATAENAVSLLRDRPPALNDIVAGRAKVVVTGHSLGGAAAVIFSAWLAEKGVDVGNMKTITFGAPAAGDAAFATAYEHRINLLRVLNAGDPIPGITTVALVNCRHFGAFYGLRDGKHLESAEWEHADSEAKLPGLTALNLISPLAAAVKARLEKHAMALYQKNLDLVVSLSSLEWRVPKEFREKLPQGGTTPSKALVPAPTKGAMELDRLLSDGYKISSQVVFDHDGLQEKAVILVRKTSGFVGIVDSFGVKVLEDYPRVGDVGAPCLLMPRVFVQGGNSACGDMKDTDYFGVSYEVGESCKLICDIYDWDRIKHLYKEKTTTTTKVADPHPKRQSGSSQSAPSCTDGGGEIRLDAGEKKLGYELTNDGGLRFQGKALIPAPGTARQGPWAKLSKPSPSGRYRMVMHVAGDSGAWGFVDEQERRFINTNIVEGWSNSFCWLPGEERVLCKSGEGGQASLFLFDIRNDTVLWVPTESNLPVPIGETCGLKIPMTEVLFKPDNSHFSFPILLACPGASEKQHRGTGDVQSTLKRVLPDWTAVELIYSDKVLDDCERKKEALRADLRVDLDDDGHDEYVVSLPGCPDTRGRGDIYIISGKRPYRFLIKDTLTYVNGVTDGWRFNVLPVARGGWHDIQLEDYQYRWNGQQYEVHRE